MVYDVLNIDDAIKHCYDKYIILKSKCEKCALEHYQLYKWLLELKSYRAGTVKGVDLNFEDIINKLEDDND